MSGDVQPRKRKEKRRKKEDSEEIPASFSSDEQLHVHKDASTGGNICAKILFFLLSFVLLVMIGLVLFEYRGSTDDETLVPVSKWAPTFDGWLEAPVKHDEHADVTESGEQEHGESEEHENESAEGEGHLSEEAASKEDEDEKDDEDEGAKDSEEEETKSVEEEEEEEEDEDEEADKLKDEESEEVDENEIEDRDESEEQEEEQEEEGSEEDAYEHGKSEEDIETEKDDADDDDNDDDGEEEDEEEDAESGREELDDDDDDDEEREVPVYQHESDEIDDLLHEIPGITESDEDEEGDNLGRSDEIIDKLKKIPGVNEKKIKEVSEEKADVPRRKQEKEVSESTQPMEGTSTVVVEQKPQEQQKSQDQSQAKLKDHQAAVKQKGVTEKPIVVKHEKPEALPPQDQPAAKSKHKTSSTEHSAMKNDGFPSGPGESGQGQKAKDVTTPGSKVTSSKKEKVSPETTKDGSSEATLMKKQKDDTGPASKSEPLAADPSKPIATGGKNVKDKDVSTDGVHSAPKASRIGDKMEHSPKGGKPGTSHKVTEQSSTTKVDTNDRIPVSESPHVGKSKEEHKKTMESKDEQGSKPLHTAASGVKSSKFDTKGAQTPTEDTVKISDLKTNMHDKLGGAGNSGSADKKVKTASSGKERETVLVEHGTKESGNLNSQDKQVKGGRSTGEKKLVEKKEETLIRTGHPPNHEKKKDEQPTPKLGGHAAKDSKVHEDSSKSKVDIEKQKAASPASAKISGGGSSEVPVKVSSDKARKVNADNTKNKPPEKSADVNVAKEKSGSDNTPPEDKHHSKSRDTKTSAIPETASKHAVGGEMKSSKTSQDKLVEEEEEEEEEDEPEPSGVALKFGVGVALVIVAHVVLVKKWNSDENLATPDTSDASQNVQQIEQQPQISKQIPQILVEPETEKDSEESSYLSSEYITRRQTLLPDDLVHDSPQRELEESESSVPSEEESDDGQEELIFKQNVYKAENAFKASHRDEKPFSEEKPYKQQSFEELMKKYHDRTPEGSDIESDEDDEEEEAEEEEEEEDDDRDLDDELIDDEDELDNEEPEEISVNKGQRSKIATSADTESTSPRKFIADTQKEHRIAAVEQKTGKHEEDEVLSGGKEEEDDEDEEEDAGDLDSEDDSLGEKFKHYQLSKTRKLQREEDEDSGSEKEIPVTKSKIPKNMGGQNAQVYSKADITNEDDWHIIQDLDKADDDAEENPEVAIHRYDTILKSHPNSPRAWYGKATALDQLAAKKKSNFILDQAIDAYKKVTSEVNNVPDKIFILAAERCIDRMRFRGIHARAVPIHKLLIARFPDNPAYQNQLAVTLLMINRSPEAKQVLEKVLQKWPRNGFAQVHYGFVLKTGNYNMTEAVRYLQEGIATREPGTIDGRFFFQLGDALMRLGRRKEALEVNELGVREGLFLSKYQRSLYNVNRLRAQPWWTPEETTYAPYFRKLEENWKQIKDEGVKALYDKNKNLYRDEAENLKDSGNWKQLELFARGRKVPTNCAKAPVTCKLIEDFPAARDCRRGQVKFSVMDPGTHVWPHCGPTNCRLRAHLGLVVPKNTYIRVAEETRTWEEGKLFIFDDSFEHEVWHNGTTTRLVLIVDVWHPELTVEEKRTLPAI